MTPDMLLEQKAFSIRRAYLSHGILPLCLLPGDKPPYWQTFKAIARSYLRD